MRSSYCCVGFPGASAPGFSGERGGFPRHAAERRLPPRLSLLFSHVPLLSSPLFCLHPSTLPDGGPFLSCCLTFLPPGTHGAGLCGVRDGPLPVFWGQTLPGADPPPPTPRLRSHRFICAVRTRPSHDVSLKLGSGDRQDRGLLAFGAALQTSASSGGSGSGAPEK